MAGRLDPEGVRYDSPVQRAVSNMQLAVCSRQ